MDGKYIWLASRRFNDRTSSFRIVSGEWDVCQHDDYNGTCETHRNDQPSLGRMDNQIKIRGYRVELAEIEACVRDESGVDVAISVGWPVTAAGADSNVVFVSDESIELDALLKRVKTRLPGYMAPSEIRRVETFPLNSNGKVDRKALLATLEAAERDD